MRGVRSRGLLTPAFLVVCAGCNPAESEPLASPSGIRDGLRVELPSSPSGFARVIDEASGVKLGFRLRDAEVDVTWEQRGIRSVSSPALPGGAELALRVTARGLEDLIHYPAKPREERAYYVVEASGAAGLRLVGNTLEWLDATGAPRLRMSPPFLIDATGRRVFASVDVPDCAIDRNPAPPWGRRPIPVAAQSCTVIVDWSHAHAVYPATLDPVWVPAGELSSPRASHTATLLQDGRVLVAGGVDQHGYLPGVEVWDPGTSTFAAAEPIPAPVNMHTATLLQDGRVLVVGGIREDASVSAQATFFKPDTGTWSPMVPSLFPRCAHTATRLLDGMVLVVGGIDEDGAPLASSEVIDPIEGAWLGPAMMVEGRYGHTATALPSGEVVVAGGTSKTATVLKRTEVYSPELEAFEASNPLAYARSGHTTVLMADGRLLAVGGSPDAATWETRNATEVWNVGGALETRRNRLHLVPLEDGNVLLVSGEVNKFPTKEVLLFHPTTNTWTVTRSLGTARESDTATLLADGQVLVIGGRDASSGAFYATTEAYRPGRLQGESCAIAAECETGQCVDGVCCDKACDAPCLACSASAKVEGPDGTCGSRASCYSHCTSEQLLYRPEGELDCSPYRCDPAAAGCFSRCSSAVQCLGGKVCSAAGQCVEPSATRLSSSEASCGIGTARGSWGWRGAAVAIALLAVFGRRRLPVLGCW